MSVIGIVGLVILSVASRIRGLIPGGNSEQIIGAFVLIGSGILNFSLSINPFTILLGLLTALSGFEIIYATVETSALVAGLLAVVNLGIAFIGGYLIGLPEESIE